MIRLGAASFARRGEIVPALARLAELTAPDLIAIDVADDPQLSIDDQTLAELRRLPALIVTLVHGPLDRRSGLWHLADSGDLCIADSSSTPIDLTGVTLAPAAQLESRLEQLDEQARRPEVVLLATLLRDERAEPAGRLLQESLGYAALQSGAGFKAWLAER